MQRSIPTGLVPVVPAKWGENGASLLTELARLIVSVKPITISLQRPRWWRVGDDFYDLVINSRVREPTKLGLEHRGYSSRCVANSIWGFGMAPVWGSSSTLAPIIGFSMRISRTCDTHTRSNGIFDIRNLFRDSQPDIERFLYI